MIANTSRRSVFAEINKVDLLVPSEFLNGDECYNEEALADWVLDNCRDELRRAITIKPSEAQSSLENASHRLKLLDNITKVQRQYLLQEEPRVVFGGLLACLLDTMDSEYGFIGEIKYEEDGTQFLQTHAITNIAWNAATRKFYEENVLDGLKFYNMNSLFGTVIKEGKCLIANEPRKHPNSAGVPEGHPPLNHFLGIPFFEQGGKVMNGMVGIANKPGGFSQKDVDFLEPLAVTCSNLIQAYNTNKENQRLINTLEEKVKERTAELELVNQSLENANQTIIEASKMQLEHFAVMAHEIRTPLNCIVGLSSLLEETTLNPFQADSLQMIVKSGELLMAVVNDVLDYAKLETDNMNIEIRRTSLQDTLDAVVHSIENKAHNKKLKVRTYYDSDVPEFLDTDSRRLQQILYNLLGNAIKFSHEGGAVELSVLLCSDDGNATTQASSTSSISTHCEEEPEKFANHTEPEPSPLQELGHDENQVQTRCPFHKAQSPASNNLQQDTVSANSKKVSRCPFTRSIIPMNLEEGSGSNSHQLLEDIDSLSASEHCSRPQIDLNGSYSEAFGDSGFVDGVNAKPRLRFVVKDYGRGIAKEDFDRIFMPFQQVNGESKVQEGTGLGLAITSRLAKGLGGVISVDSEKGKWSQFSFDIPLRAEPVDVNSLTKSLSDTRICLVGKGPGQSLIENIAKDSEIEFVKGNDCGILEVLASSSCELYGKGPINVCLIHEDLYDMEAYQKLAMKSRSILMTFGPKYCVTESQHHFRSIVRTLPSVILRSILSHKEKIEYQNLSAPPVANFADGAAKTNSTIDYGKIRALIAEDNVVNQKVLSRMLQRIGLHDIDIVDNGKKAVEVSSNKAYDLIFMDMQMPVMCGLDATRLIVERRKGALKPEVIFVTAHASDDFEASAKAAGGSGFISKPFNLKAIQRFFQTLPAVLS